MIGRTGYPLQALVPDQIVKYRRLLEYYLGGERILRVKKRAKMRPKERKARAQDPLL
jgi:hypothetical protein